MVPKQQKSSSRQNKVHKQQERLGDEQQRQSTDKLLNQGNSALTSLVRRSYLTKLSKDPSIKHIF